MHGIIDPPYLFRLTDPASFPIVRPQLTKRRQSRLSYRVARRVFDLRGVGAVLLDVHHEGPTALRGMLQMFCDRVVLFLPSIERSATQETCRVVGVRFVGVVEETRMRQLWRKPLAMRNPPRTSSDAYFSRRRPPMRPGDRFRGLRARSSSLLRLQHQVEAGKAGAKRFHGLGHCGRMRIGVKTKPDLKNRWGCRCDECPSEGESGAMMLSGGRLFTPACLGRLCNARRARSRGLTRRPWQPGSLRPPPGVRQSRFLDARWPFRYPAVLPLAFSFPPSVRRGDYVLNCSERVIADGLLIPCLPTALAVQFLPSLRFLLPLPFFPSSVEPQRCAKLR